MTDNLEESIEIAAPPARVWTLVSDIPRMATYSPQVVKTFVKGDGTAGTTMVNINRKGLLVWPTQSKVVDCTPESSFAWRIKENYTIWGFTLEPTADGGTRLTQRREAPEGISNLSLRLTKTVLGGVDGFTQHLREGMRETLTKIKADAEK